jgi:hypothetical protein
MRANDGVRRLAGEARGFRDVLSEINGNRKISDRGVGGSRSLRSERGFMARCCPR